MSYAAPYPNCSTQYSKSFPLLTTRTHTPNQPHPPVVLADAGTHPPCCPRGCTNPPLSPPFPLQGGKVRMGVQTSPPPLRVLADAGTHPPPLALTTRLSHGPPPRRCAPPERPRPYRHPLSSNSHGSGNPSLPPSHLRYTQPPHIIVPSPT